MWRRIPPWEKQYEIGPSSWIGSKRFTWKPLEAWTFSFRQSLLARNESCWTALKVENSMKTREQSLFALHRYLKEFDFWNLNTSFSGYQFWMDVEAPCCTLGFEMAWWFVPIWGFQPEINHPISLARADASMRTQQEMAFPNLGHVRVKLESLFQPGGMLAKLEFLLPKVYLPTLPF